MKKIDLINAGLFLILAICFGAVVHAIIEHCNSMPNQTEKAKQRTIEYIGFDGKKHQAIVIKTAQHNWVLVEKK